jgi:acyl-CoA thioester hydrolase
VGERVRITSRLLDADAKRLHYFHEMFHAEQGHRVASQELLALHIDLRVRRTTAFAPDVLERIQGVVREGAVEPLPAAVGRRIAMPAPRGL